MIKICGNITKIEETQQGMIVTIEADRSKLTLGLCKITQETEAYELESSVTYFGGVPQQNTGRSVLLNHADSELY
jgi:hypothetical protein